MKYSLSFQCQHTHPFDINLFLEQVEVPLLLDYIAEEDDCTYYYLYRKDLSVSYFEIIDSYNGHYEISIDGLACYEDYRLFPYLADCLHRYLNDSPFPTINGQSVYELYQEEKIEEYIGEEIATLKATLTIAPRYYPMLAMESCYISLHQLAEYGVCLHSSTPRIYGYIHYLMRHGKLPQAQPEQLQEDMERFSEEIQADVPQHLSIGRVKSWQTDGTETWESYSQEDVTLLCQLARQYQSGEPIEGVVLNDIGTIYQAGIGVEADAQVAAYWYKEACRCGELVYAPANLGDLYRKGGNNLPASLPKAFEAYSQSSEPYALYRIGQAYEEGWTEAPNLPKAMKLYGRSAEKGHHLAIKRLKNEKR